MVEDSEAAPMWIGADELARRVSPGRARELLRAALAGGLDPSRTRHARSSRLDVVTCS